MTTPATPATYENKPGCSNWAECSDHRVCTDESGVSAASTSTGTLVPA